VALRIEDYALIGDTETAALVGIDGSIDWLCLPRFDSPACFAALLGAPEHGRWVICPAGGVRRVRRRYRPGTLVLETEWETEDGVVRVVDCMPPRDRIPDVLRLVEGVSGRVLMRLELIVRFDYGALVPWVRRHEPYLEAVAGPDALRLRAPVELHGENLTTVADFAVGEGQRVPFGLSWHASHEAPPPAQDPVRSVEATQRWWEEWSSRCTYDGRYRGPVSESLRALKAMTYHPTGGIVAAVTTSLPEHVGGVRNWDYRFCWLRDATFTLLSLLAAGYTQEAELWRDWLLRAVAGQPDAMQIMYGCAGERRLPELELPWLPGYEGSTPVRIGNGAAQQFQLDVYGELMDSLHDARDAGIDPASAAWDVQAKLMEFLETAWRREDEGIWEVRGPRRHFVHSKVMAWVAFDRAVKAVERFGLEGPADRWRALREQVHAEVCREGFDADRTTFTQSYGSQQLDASLLMIPLVGFLAPDDRRVDGTIRAIERELIEDGFVMRYPTQLDVDGLPAGEGAFLPCSFWLVDCLELTGRHPEALALFERLLALRNDVGLLSEEYDPHAGRLVGNFPQAFTHVGLVNSAFNLDRGLGPASRRRQA
jgi:GH15 family glucan-1,4-alpha-glucosidase